MDEIKELTTLEEVKAFSVPYRMKILDYMYSFKAPATVKNIADKMGETSAKIHYHVKIMEEVGIVQLVYTKTINGIIAKFYEPAAEQFRINHTSGNIEDKFKMLNEAQKTISLTYEESKNSFLEQLEKTDKKHNGFVTNDEIYLTLEEFSKIQKEIMDIYKKYSSHTKDDGKTRYKTFFSIIDLE